MNQWLDEHDPQWDVSEIVTLLGTGPIRWSGVHSEPKKASGGMDDFQNTQEYL